MTLRLTPLVLLLGCAFALSACAQHDLVALRIEALDGGTPRGAELDAGDRADGEAPRDSRPGTGETRPMPTLLDGSDCSPSSRSLFSVISKIDPETCRIDIADVAVTDVVLTIFLASLTPTPVAQNGKPIPLSCMGPQIWYALGTEYFVCPAHCVAALDWLKNYRIQSLKCPGAGMP